MLSEDDDDDDDDLDELALDDISIFGTKSGHKNFLPVPVPGRVNSRIEDHPRTPPAARLHLHQINPQSTMSSSRYPKRRRISGREKETTLAPPPPPLPPSLPAPQQTRNYDSSPDELAPSSDHENYRPSRTTSRPKRNTKEKKKTLPEPQKPVAVTVMPIADPEEPPIATTAPEASDDELTVTAAATAESEMNGDSDGESTIILTKDEADSSEEQSTPKAEAPLEDDPDEEDEPPRSVLHNLGNDDIIKPPAYSVDENKTTSVAEDPEAVIEEHNIVPEPSVEHHAQLEVPQFFRRSNTFRGSFGKVSPRPSPDRYSSRSPPPYSRISTPVATPREPLIAPPQFVPYREKLCLKGHKRAVTAVKFSPDGRLIASCCIVSLLPSFIPAS